MIRVGFIVAVSKEWMGGLNYYKNLFFALSTLEDKQIEPIIFLGKKADLEIIEKFKPYVKIVQDSLFDRKSLKWFLSKVLERVFKTTIITTRLLNQYNVSVLSHSDITTGFKNFIKINWIPDFQHIHLPELFSNDELMQRDNSFLKTLQNSEQVIVSSNDAYKDAKDFAPQYINKVKVLQFVSQPNQKVFNLDKAYIKSLEIKYGFKGKFFYLPNQFWKHKNHALVFEATKMLKDQGIDILILCSGHMHDYRNPDYIQTLQNYIKQNELQDNIKLLGLIDYTDVLCFMRFSIAVINPSLFEGWSSTVEECKSIGKNMVLSNIPIHKEQNPPDSLYFDPSDAQELSNSLKKLYLDNTPIPNKELESHAKYELKRRTLDFANTYQNIILASIKAAKR